MRLPASRLLPLALALAFAGVSAASDKPAALPAYVKAAVADPARGKDAQIDARRKVGELVAFSEAKPGDKVVDLIPGSGYFTRVFSNVVGVKGRVYMLWPRQYANEARPDVANSDKLAKSPGFGNIEVIEQPGE